MTASRTTPTLCVLVIITGPSRNRILLPSRAGHFAVAIERPPSSKYGIHHGIHATGKNGRDAGSDRAIADIALAFAGDERGVADGDAGNVGYGVKRAWRAVKRNAQSARARGLAGGVS